VILAPIPDVDVREVGMRVGSADLGGLLGLPEHPVGLVIFAHGSGSSRFSPRNNAVARALRRQGLATLLFDLLTEAESGDRANIFDISLLAERLLSATRWAGSQSDASDLAVGYFGASTGAAAALVAAASLGPAASAVVSRGGRPDLALSVLDRVTAPTLLIVGGYDTHVLDLNRIALDALRCEKALEIVPHATHLFEEAGALAAAAELAGRWFGAHLAPQG
jgi:putative phosphoribosyl transferase